MCSPLAAGIALSAGSSLGRGLSNRAYVQEVNNQNQRAYQMSQRAREEERERQRGFEQQQMTAVDDTRQSFSRENFDTEREASAESFVQTLAQRPGVLSETSLLAGQEASSDAVRGRIARDAATEASTTRERIQALAQLTGFGTTGADRGFTFGRAADDVSTVGGLRRGSLSVGHQEQQIPAATVRPGNTTFLDILSGVGGLAAGGGLNGLLGGGAGGGGMFSNLFSGGGGSGLFRAAGTPTASGALY